MDTEKTPVLRIPSWLRSFRTSKGDVSVPQKKEARPASCQQKEFLRSYHRCLVSEKNKEPEEGSNHGSQDFARASLMSIRKIWAEEEKAKACSERIKSERRPKKSCSLRTKVLGSPSKIPISEKMQTHQKELQLSFRHISVLSNKENIAPVFAPKCKSYGNWGSEGSSHDNLASEIVLSAARHAKNRRSLVRECDVWKTAVSNVGLPRTSTELQQLHKTGKTQDLPALSPVIKAARNEKDKAVQGWVMQNGGRGGELLARHTLPCVQQNQLPHRQFVEDTIPEYIDNAPKIPPRTYLAKLAHAKAHLAKTVTPVCARASTTAHNINGAKSALSGHGHSLCNKLEHDCLLSSKKAATKQRISSERHRRMCGEVVHSGENPSKHQQLRKAVRPQVQNNPSYNTGYTSRTQNLKKNCRATGSDVMADDEATVLNCSCDRCLGKFSAAGKHLPGTTGDLRNNCQCGIQLQTRNSCSSKYGKHVSAVSHHCTCCQLKKFARLKVIADAKAETSAYTEASCEQIPEKAAKCSASAKYAFHCQDQITKVIEEAVKASIEKLLTSNSIPQLSKSRSAEALHEPTQFKKAISSPLKYIPLSSCRSGTTGALLSSTDGATVDSNIALVHQPYFTGAAVNEVIDDDDDQIFKTCSQSPHSEIDMERSTSLPSLVESSSPAKLKVSAAFIKLVKRVGSCHGNDEISSEHASFLDGAGAQGSLTSRQSCSECSSSCTEGCWQPAESHCTNDLSVHPEKTSHQMAHSGANDSKSQSGEHSQFGPEFSYSELQSSPELDKSRSCLGSVPGRMPPDGWERTPPCDAPLRAELDDELSELNPCMSGDMPENCFSSDSDGSDDQHILEEVIRKGMGVAPPIKLPLRCLNLVKTPRKFKAGEMFCGKAKLKLSAYVNSGHVTVHVIRAAKLVTSRGGSANAYIKVSLQPDHTQRAHWRTAVVRSCRNPGFDHKFSFELMSEDTGKRLLVTVWHRDIENKHSELLGSMSFGMGKILNSDQYVKGWYRLLRQDLGIHRHYAARCSRGPCTRVKTSLADNILTASKNS